MLEAVVGAGQRALLALVGGADVRMVGHGRRPRVWMVNVRSLRGFVYGSTVLPPVVVAPARVGVVFDV